jgi:hypothetical protein
MIDIIILMSSYRNKLPVLVLAYFVGSWGFGATYYFVNKILKEGKYPDLENTALLTLESFIIGGMGGFLLSFILPFTAPLMAITEITRLFMNRIQINVSVRQ